MIICLLPLGRNRFELYSEPGEDAVAIADPPAGRMARWLAAGHARWRDLVQVARAGRATGRISRWRDRVVCHLAESIAEQRTLWALRAQPRARLLYPAGLTAVEARSTLDRVLAHAWRHHGIWFVIDLLAFIVSAILAPVPGPNLVAYYLAFRVVGHLQSWRGARRAMGQVSWTLEPDAHLAELALLVHVPAEDRRTRVDAIAARLNLRHLPRFFERVGA